jgi:hypothetical protein
MPVEMMAIFAIVGAVAVSIAGVAAYLKPGIVGAKINTIKC